MKWWTRSWERPPKSSASVLVPSSVSKLYSFSIGTQGSSSRSRASSSLRRVSSFSRSTSASRAACHSSRVPVLCSVILGASLIVDCRLGLSLFLCRGGCSSGRGRSRRRWLVPTSGPVPATCCTLEARALCQAGPCGDRRSAVAARRGSAQRPPTGAPPPWRRVLESRRLDNETSLVPCGQQPELKRLAEVVAYGPVLDHLVILESPDVDLLSAERLAGRRLAKELADVAAVHGHARHDLVVLADHVFDVGPHRAPKPMQPVDGFVEALRSLGIIGGSLVIHEVGIDELACRLEVPLLEEVHEYSPGDLLVLL